jgi:hypothetical protein
MAGVKLSALLIIAGMLCAGCSLFYSNVFAGLDKPPAPKASDYEGPNGLTKLGADLDSPDVVALLTADPTTVAQIQAYLDTQYSLGVQPANADAQTAAALSADLGLKTTQGDVLVNNIVTTIMSNPSGDISSLIKAVTPASVLADSTGGDFATMVDGLLDAWTLYDRLGASIGTPLGAPPGMNLGDVAQKAAAAYMMYAVVVITLEAAPYSYTQVEAETQMFDVATDQPNSISAVTVDPFSSMPQSLKNIFDAAGLPYPHHL